jgi:hypothetical protein
MIFYCRPPRRHDMLHAIFNKQCAAFFFKERSLGGMNSNQD